MYYYCCFAFSCYLDFYLTGLLKLLPMIIVFLFVCFAGLMGLVVVCFVVGGLL